MGLSSIIYALAVFCGSVLLAWISRIFLTRLAKKLAGKTRTTLDDATITAMEKPILALIIVGGLYLALAVSLGTSSLSLPPVVQRYLFRGLGIALSLLGIYAALALVNGVINWYKRQAATIHKDVGLALRAIEILRLAVLFIALLGAVAAVLNILELGSAPVTGWIGSHGWRIVFIVLISILVVIAMGELIPRLVDRSLAQRTGESADEKHKRGHTLSRVLTNTGQVVVLLFTAFMILSELEIDIAPILAGVGVAGIAIGFGAQSLIKDFLSGIFIILENQYRVGDVVRIADISGLVEDITLRKTILRDLDGTVHNVPNGEIRVASNFTKEWSRVNLNISVSYNEDLDKVMLVINRVGQELARDDQWAPMIITPPQAVRVDNLGDSGIEIKILGDTLPIRQWDVTGELRKRLKKAFDDEGIEIPWPHTKVYFGNPLVTGKGPAGEKPASPPAKAP